MYNENQKIKFLNKHKTDREYYMDIFEKISPIETSKDLDISKMTSSDTASCLNEVGNLEEIDCAISKLRIYIDWCVDKKYSKINFMNEQLTSKKAYLKLIEELRQQKSM